MELKLEIFGFQNSEVKELIKKGKLETGHGTYRIKDDILSLQRTDGTNKEWKISEIGCDDNE